MLGLSPSPTFTSNDARAWAWLPKKAMLVQDLVRSQPVTRTISSIRSIPSPSRRAKANQWSIFLNIHLPKSPCARVSSRRALSGRHNTAPFRLLGHANETCWKSSDLRQYQQAMKGLDCGSELRRGTKVWCRLHTDFGRTVIAATKRTCIDRTKVMEDKWFMILGHAKLVRWIICGKQGVEKTVELAPANEPNVANFHGHTRSRRSWVPQGMSVSRIHDCELLAKDIVVGHLGGRGCRI